MNLGNWNSNIILAIGMLLIFLTGCEYDAPSSIWQPEQQGAPDPVITSVEPEAFALSGVTKITIRGENFSVIPAQNSVYFNKEKGRLISATASELVVIPPNIESNSITITVVVEAAYHSATHSPYRLEFVFRDVVKEEQVYAIAMDRDENLYTHARGSIVNKISPVGEISQYATTSFARSSTMRIGHGGFLYLQRNDSKSFYRIAPGGGTTEEFVSFSRKVSFFDFDEHQNIYSGGNQSGIYVTAPDQTITSTELFRDQDIRSIRIFNGYLYVAATGDTTGIWRSKILANDGTLGKTELVFNWANSGDFTNSEILDITFAEDGDLYVGTDHSLGAALGAGDEAKDPILVIHPDGSSETLYIGVLNSPASHLCWGNGQYLYVNRWAQGRANSGIARVTMAKNGAPYYGRQ